MSKEKKLNFFFFMNRQPKISGKVTKEKFLFFTESHQTLTENWQYLHCCCSRQRKDSIIKRFLLFLKIVLLTTNYLTWWLSDSHFLLFECNKARHRKRDLNLMLVSILMATTTFQSRCVESEESKLQEITRTTQVITRSLAFGRRQKYNKALNNLLT